MDVSQSQTKSTKPNGPAPRRASRLIVRNLPFDITEQDLMAIFLPYGPIYSIDIPMSVPTSKVEVDEDVDGDGDVKMEETSQSASANRIAAKPRGKGFAFVWMWTKKEAEKALEGCNGMKVKAGFAEGMVKDKQRRKKERREEKKRLAQEAIVGHGEGGDEGGTEAKVLDIGERVIAVDWALSKEKWEVEKKRIEDEAEDEDEASGSDEGSKEDDEVDEGLGVHENEAGSSDEESDSEDQDEEGRSDDEERTRPQLPPPEAGTTLFVRNVPFEATEDELRTLYVFLSVQSPSRAHTHRSPHQISCIWPSALCPNDSRSC